MFCFLVDGVFMGLWGNSVGDIFFESTCKSMKWDMTKTTLLYFQDFQNVNNDQNVFELENEKLVFYSPLLNDDGAIVGKGEKLAELVGEKFVENGMFMRAC